MAEQDEPEDNGVVVEQHLSVFAELFQEREKMNVSMKSKINQWLLASNCMLKLL